MCHIMHRTSLEDRLNGTSLHLAHHIIHTPEILFPPHTTRDTMASLPSIFELGAGTGFLSILLAQMGADVIATDLEAEEGRDSPLERLKGNVALSTTIPQPH